MQRRIILHGHLADKYPHPIELFAETVAEAMSALEQIVELHPEDGQLHSVKIDGVDTDIALYSPMSELSELHIRPFEGGAGGRGIGQVILGVTLIALAVWNPAFLVAAEISAGSLALTGGMMLAGGLLQMLAPMPDMGINNEQSDESSQFLGGNQNTVKIGTNIVLAYGIEKLSGHYLSFDVDALDQTDDDKLSNTHVYDGYADFPSLIEGLEDQEAAGEEDDDKRDQSDIELSVEQDAYIVRDFQSVPVPVLLPVFDSDIPAPDNVPTSAWS